MGDRVNCFDWHNRSSDYLDGTLIGAAKREADEHLDACPTCRERHQHYRRILDTLSHQVRTPLPIPLRKNPLVFTWPRLGLRSGKWERNPWIVRTGIEGLGIAVGLLLLVAIIPRVRTLYERSVEKRLDEFSLAELHKPDSAEHPAPSRGKLPAQGEAVAQNEESEGDDFTGEYGEETEDDGAASSEDASADTVQVGSSEIWRFNLKTDSPHEVQPKVVALLRSLNVPQDTPGLGGIEAPGGIQFDLVVSVSVVSNLRLGLKKLAAPAPQASAEDNSAAPTATFTWYKNKSRRKIAAGKARVVIWLSQM